MKKLFTILMCVCAAFVLFGCGGSKEIDYEFEVLKPSDIEKETISIKFRVRSGVVANALNDELIPDFNKVYPNINVEVDAIQGDYNDLKTTTRSELSSISKNTPDMVIGYPDHFTEYFAGANLVNLQKYIDDPTVGYTQEEIDDFLPSYMAENSGYDAANPNDLYGLPFNKSTEVLVYNKTFFEHVFGENYLEKIPTTWQELEAVCKEIIALVKEGKADDLWVESTASDGTKTYLKVSDYVNKGTFIPFGYDSEDNAFITMTRQFGGEYTERVSVVKGKVKYKNENVIKGLEYFGRLKDEGIFGVSGSWGEKYCSTLVQNIQCVMTIGSSAGVDYNASTSTKYKYELGIAEIPYYYDEALGENQNKYVIQQGTNICILNQNTNKQRLACWLFVKFLLESQNTAKFAMETGGYLPVRKSAYETDEYKEYLSNPTDDKVSYSKAANVALNYINNGYTMFVDDPFVGSSTIRENVGTLFATLITNKNTTTRDYINSLLTNSYNTLGGGFQ